MPENVLKDVFGKAAPDAVVTVLAMGARPLQTMNATVNMAHVLRMPQVDRHMAL